jgi:transposase
MRYIKLKNEDLEKLKKLYRTDGSATVRKRSQCLVLSHQGRNIVDLKKIYSVDRRTIERWFNSWEKKVSVPYQYSPAGEQKRGWRVSKRRWPASWSSTTGT